MMYITVVVSCCLCQYIKFLWLISQISYKIIVTCIYDSTALQSMQYMYMYVELDQVFQLILFIL